MLRNFSNTKIPTKFTFQATCISNLETMRDNPHSGKIPPASGPQDPQSPHHRPLTSPPRSPPPVSIPPRTTSSPRTSRIARVSSVSKQVPVTFESLPNPPEFQPPPLPPRSSLEESVPSNDDASSNSGQNPDAERMARGIVSTLAPAMQELDMRVVAVRATQLDILKEVERLHAELQMYHSNVEDTRIAEMDSLLQRLAAARKRLGATNSILKLVQGRLDKCFVLVRPFSGE
ncbi:hypothetical protein BJ742DRAFT_21728 [Cladochytrium replicatum]|nr:hypothetical protein BJ742DRAFT_21728 [Cladochytrium replicatum]